MAEPVLIEAIRELVADRTGAPLEKITEGTMLAYDLGVDGDDAYEFLEAYAERFRVSLSGFVFLDHFGWEGTDVATSMFVAAAQVVSPRFRQKWRDARSYEREITIRHLAHCAELGHWAPSIVRPQKARTRSKHLVAFLLWSISSGVFAALELALLSGAVLGLYCAGEFFLAHDIRHGSVCALIAAVCSGVLLLQARMTRIYLREKEVWQRVSPVAD